MSFADSLVPEDKAGMPIACVLMITELRCIIVLVSYPSRRGLGMSLPRIMG